MTQMRADKKRTKSSSHEIKRLWNRSWWRWGKNCTIMVRRWGRCECLCSSSTNSSVHDSTARNFQGARLTIHQTCTSNSSKMLRVGGKRQINASAAVAAWRSINLIIWSVKRLIVINACCQCWWIDMRWSDGDLLVGLESLSRWLMNEFDEE